jgi:hypothetical protein
VSVNVGARAADAVEIALGPKLEGERQEDAQKTARDETHWNKRKADNDDENQPNDYPHKRTRGVRVDYQKLNDPHPELGEESFGTNPNTSAGDECRNLKEVKNSPEWPKWQEAIRAELDQLERMGTWQLVEPPEGVKPIPNKWVFAKKKDNQGNITKYKARLVAKGCSQRPGRDYDETHSPVVRLETLRAILAIAPGKKLFIQQMDVKGAYLNGTLKERVYMRQPEGFEDGTGLVLLLARAGVFEKMQ